MTALIICPKGRGNTYSVAVHMKKALGADLLALEVGSRPDFSQYEDIVLATGVYGGKGHRDLLQWLKLLEPERFGPNVRFHILLTWFGRGRSDQSAVNSINRVLARKGWKAEADIHTCPGGKLFIQRGHPNEQDIREAVDWMDKVCTP